MKILKFITLLIFSLLFSLCVFVLLENLSSFFIKQNNNGLHDILRLLKQDSVLFWKQKPNLNTEFKKQKVVTNKIGFRAHEIQEKKKTRIICLGASPTFGYGVKYEDTYPFVIENLLKQNNYDVEVINAGEIGYSSYQGLCLFKKEIIYLKPDIITVSFVINDIDKYRFFRSSSLYDNQLKPLPELVVTMNNFVYDLNFFKLVNKILLSNLSKRMQYYGKNYNNQYNENRRVSLKQYEKNLNAFIDFAENNNIKIVFMVMPVNLPTKPKINDDEKNKIENLITALENKLRQEDYAECKRILSKILKIDTFSAKTHYYLGVLAEKENKFALSDQYFEKAKNFEVFDCATISLEYNEIMRKVASARNIVLCDCAKEFKNHRNCDSLFVDPKYDCFHPNDKGHKIIADTLTEKIINNFKGVMWNANKV